MTTYIQKFIPNFPQRQTNELTLAEWSNRLLSNNLILIEILNEYETRIAELETKVAQLETNSATQTGEQ